MRVLLLNPPAETLYIRDQFCSHESKGNYYWQPLDFLMLSGRLDAAGYELAVVDAVAERLTRDQAQTRIASFRPHAIVFLTGCDSFQEDIRFIEDAKRAGARLAVGMGDNTREYGEELLNEFPAMDACLNDFVTHGLVAFLQSDLDQAFNMVVRTPSGIRAVPAPPQPKLFSIPAPRYGLFPLARYRMPFNRHHPYATTITSIWCPYGCIFCPFAKTTYRIRDIDDTMRNLATIRRMGIRQVHFADWTFGLDRKHTLTLLEAMSAARLGLTWSCLTRVDLVDSESLEAMKLAGCETVEFGVESGSARMLERYHKGTTVEQIRRAFRAAKESRIATLATFVLGLPGETHESLQETLDLALEIDPTFSSFNMASPQPGTQLRRDMIAAGSLDPTRPAILDSSHTIPAFSTPTLSATDVYEFWSRAVRRFYFRPGYVARRLLRIRSFHELANHARNGLSLFGRLVRPARGQPASE